MKKYRKKVKEVYAEQYLGDFVVGLCRCSGEAHTHSLNGRQLVFVGDFIVPEIDGDHFYPIKESVFHELYEEVE